MREPDGRRRLAYALLFALIIGALLTMGNPISHLKADLRADAKGFFFSIEYSAKLLSR